MLSHPIELMENSTVAELINETRQWNEELIDGVFACDEAAMIKKNTAGKGHYRGCIDMGPLSWWKVHM